MSTSIERTAARNLIAGTGCDRQTSALVRAWRTRYVPAVPLRASPIAAVVTWIAMVSGAARADVGVAIVDVPGAPAPGSRVSSALVRAGAGERARGGVVGDATAALSGGAVPAASLAAFRRTRDLAEQGWRAYLQVAGAVAADRLAEARASADVVLPWDGGREVYADVALRLGAVLDHLGRRGEAAELMRLAAALDPERLVTTAEFSPDVVAAFDAARAAAVPTVPTAIAVVGAGVGAGVGVGEPVVEPVVEIDGVRVSGPTVALAVGPHVAVARAPGYHPRGVSFAVGTSPAELRIELAVDPRARALQSPMLDVGVAEDAAARTLAAIALYADVDAVVIAASVWRRGGPALLAQRCAGEPVRCSEIVEVEHTSDAASLDAAAAAAWRSLRDASHSEPPTLSSDPRVTERQSPPPPAAARRWYRNWWLWTGVGIAAVAVGTTAAVLAGDDRTVVTVDPGDFDGP
jgi:hypothetical protein